MIDDQLAEDIQAFTQPLPETLVAALTDYAELESEYKSLGFDMDAKRAIIRTEVAALGGKARVPHVAAVSIVPASESHSYDTDAVDQIIIQAIADGDHHTAKALTAARKTTRRKESLRIVLDKGYTR